MFFSATPLYLSVSTCPLPLSFLPLLPFLPFGGPKKGQKRPKKAGEKQSAANIQANMNAAGKEAAA